MNLLQYTEEMEIMTELNTINKEKQSRTKIVLRYWSD